MARNVDPVIEIQPEYPQEGRNEYVVDVKNGLNLREKPNGAILATLKHESRVTVINEAGSWAWVETDSGSGCVMTQYLRKIV